jgi:hypothetical protein
MVSTTWVHVMIVFVLTLPLTYHGLATLMEHAGTASAGGAIGKVRAITAKTYRGYVRNHVPASMASMKLTDVRPRTVQKVIDDALAAGLKPRSVLQLHRVMSAMFRQAVKSREIAVNPSDGVTPRRHVDRSASLLRRNRSSRSSTTRSPLSASRSPSLLRVAFGEAKWAVCGRTTSI